MAVELAQVLEQSSRTASKVQARTKPTKIYAYWTLGKTSQLYQAGCVHASELTSMRLLRNASVHITTH